MSVNDGVPALRLSYNTSALCPAGFGRHSSTVAAVEYMCNATTSLSATDLPHTTCTSCSPGTARQEKDSTNTCSLCQPGTFASASGAVVCLSCVAGEQDLLHISFKCECADVISLKVFLQSTVVLPRVNLARQARSAGKMAAVTVPIVLQGNISLKQGKNSAGLVRLVLLR